MALKDDLAFYGQVTKNIVGGLGDKLSSAMTPAPPAPNIYTNSIYSGGVQPPTAEQSAPIVALTGTPKTKGESATVPKGGLQAPFSVKLNNGITYSSPGDGIRTFSAGTQGQDGYGSVTALGRTGPASNPSQVGRFSGMRQPAAQAVPAVQQQGPSPLEISIANLDRINAVPANNAGLRSMPTAEQLAGMSRPERRFAVRAAGLANDATQLDNQRFQTLTSAATSNRTADLNAMASADTTAAYKERTLQEGGLRVAQAAEAQSKANAGLRLAAAADKINQFKPGTDEYNTAVSEYRVLSGTAGNAEKPDIRMRAVKNEFGATIDEEPILVTPQGVRTLPKILSPAEQAKVNFDTMIQADPALAKAYSLKKPEEQQAEFQKYLQSLK